MSASDNNNQNPVGNADPQSQNNDENNEMATDQLEEESFKDTINGVKHALGRLNYDMKTISALQLQANNLDFEGKEYHFDDNYTYNADRALENAVNDIKSKQAEHERVNGKEKFILSHEDLLQVSILLNRRAEKMRRDTHEVFALVSELQKKLIAK